VTAAPLEALLDALLFEGYALYPYTGTAAKNATPTPFGIVYPPVYAHGAPAAFDLLRLHGVVQGGGDVGIKAEVRCLQAAPEGGHRAVERRLPVLEGSLARLAAGSRVVPFDLGGLVGRVRLSARPLMPDVWRVAVCVHNTTAVAPDLDRAEALRHSLLSTHPVLHVHGGTFASPLERAGALGGAVANCESRNTYPVLATEGDDVLLGATIALPDHPELAPESRGSLFDGTEIEEALLLHLLALTDGEREQVAAGDPALREVIERAAAATPADIARLHGRTVVSDPRPSGGLP
jgi:hypothetical protein